MPVNVQHSILRHCILIYRKFCICVSALFKKKSVTRVICLLFSFPLRCENSMAADSDLVIVIYLQCEVYELQNPHPNILTVLLA